jgi:hypothetical protein
MRITTGNNNSRGSLLVKTGDTDLMRITTSNEPLELLSPVVILIRSVSPVLTSNEPLEGDNNSRGSLLVKTGDTDLMRITTGDNNSRRSLLVKTGDTDLTRITTGTTTLEVCGDPHQICIICFN